jgi:hypothetical protein
MDAWLLSSFIRASVRRLVSGVVGSIAGAKLAEVSTSFKEPSREAEKEVRVTWARLAPTGN